MRLYLLKAMVRLLAEDASVEAGALLWAEWERRGATKMHDDLVQEIVARPWPPWFPGDPFLSTEAFCISKMVVVPQPA